MLWNIIFFVNFFKVLGVDYDAPVTGISKAYQHWLEHSTNPRYHGMDSGPSTPIMEGEQAPPQSSVPPAYEEAHPPRRGRNPNPPPQSSARSGEEGVNTIKGHQLAVEGRIPIQSQFTTCSMLLQSRLLTKISPRPRKKLSLSKLLGYSSYLFSYVNIYIFI